MRGATAFAAGLLACTLAGCAEPVFVPKAGPNAPGYPDKTVPPPPKVKVVHAAGKPSPDGGSIDSVHRENGEFEVIGWAHIAPRRPRGVLRIFLPDSVNARISNVEVVPRADVVAAYKDATLAWSGFTIRVRGNLPGEQGICVLSRSKKGTFRLHNSDDGLCPPDQGDSAAQ